MRFKVKSRVASHEENRRKLCLCCQKKKTDMKLIGNEMKEKIKILSKNIRFTDDRLPTSICSTCRLSVYKSVKSTKTFEFPNYARFTHVPKLTRSKGNESMLVCKCTLCDLVRSDSGAIQKKGPNSPPKKDETIIKQCTKCLSQVGRGIRHRCTQSQKYKNVRNTIQNHLPDKSKEHLACEVIKESVSKKQNNDESQNSNSTISLSQYHGRPLVIDVQPKSQYHGLISADDMLKLQTRFGLSFNTIFGIATFIRITLKDRKCIETDLKCKLRAMSHRLDQYFDVGKAEFKTTKGKISTIEEKQFVFCKNVIELCHHVERERGAVGNYKLGIDGGGNFLKICISIQNDDTTNKVREKRVLRRSYSKDSIDIKFLDSGVKKLLIIGLVESTQENFDNVSLLWFLLKLNEIKCTVATDLKLANIIIGIMTHASKYPCTWCSTSSDELYKIGTLRTIGSIVKNVAAWEEDGAKKERAQLFENCVNKPLFDYDENVEIIDIIPPPELHLLIGTVNKIFEHMLIECKREAEEWVKKCSVSREVYFGKSSFNGNSSRKLLRNIDQLRRISEKYDGHCLKYVKCLEDFDSVVKSCFSSDLDPKFESHILRFEKSYIALDIPLTPKVHALIKHVPYFCGKHEKGLGYYSEQAMESVHADFKKTWNKYKVDKSHPNYSERLLKAICEYNSSHI